MPTVTVFYAEGNKRSKVLGEAAFSGLRRTGANVVIRRSDQFKEVRSDYAVFYGLSNGLDKIFKAYREQAVAVYIDLGYWHRRIRSRYDGHHKIIINSRHPTDYFQNRTHNDSRFKKLNVPIAPWQKGCNKILVASMSQKAAIAEGIAPFSWEREIIEKIKRYTDMEIIYRPKPNCCRARPIKGTIFDKKRALEDVLKECHAVVTRQSNVAVDALLHGVPVFCEKGVASVMSSGDLSNIMSPLRPKNRLGWASDIAWCQFTTSEIATGLPFFHLKEEGLLP